MPRLSLFAALFLGLLLSRAAFAVEPTPVPPATAPRAQQAVDRAIGYLQIQSGAWLSHGRCASCHHVAMPLWALSVAGRRGYAIDRKFLADSAEDTLGSVQKMIGAGIENNPAAPPDPRPIGQGVNMGAVFMAVAVESLPARDAGQKQSLKRIAAQIAKKQRNDGSWGFYLSRPPISESQTTDAAWILMALQGETDSGAAGRNRVPLEKGIAWLNGAKPSDGQQQVEALKLLVAIRAGEPRGKMQPAVDALLARQRPDGGWGQTASLPSDAFATGEALYVLARAGCTGSNPQIERGIRFLTAAQKPDGSWPMTSRATPDGRPGHAKSLGPITCGAAAWATMGLASLTPGPNGLHADSRRPSEAAAIR